MTISRTRNARPTTHPAESGVKMRTRRLMLDTAVNLMQSGLTPSVAGVAKSAGVSRATAYRYFPSEAALVHAVVDEAIGPILEWAPRDTGVQERVADLLRTAMPRIEEFEATFKAALRLSLEQWAQRRAGTLGSEPQFTRGHRVDLLMEATAPLGESLAHGSQLRLAQALSLVFGVEVLNVLKDIWGLDQGQAGDVVQWAARALINAAEAEGAANASAASETAEHTQDVSATSVRRAGD